VSRELDYLLPSHGNFRDCRDLTAADYAGREVLLIRTNDYWNGERHSVVDRFARECDAETLLVVGIYRVSRCRTPPLVRDFVTYGGIQRGINDRWP
jgi:hypothetical protein